MSTWPTGMRLIVRKERLHPAAQLGFTDIDGNRLTCFATNTKGGRLADLRHRRRARCEDRIRNARDPGLCNLPLHDTAQKRRDPPLGTQTASSAPVLRRLDVALRSAPTFQAEQARAQAFGARSLNEFKKEHSWQRDESQVPYVYSLDLATNEELSGGHTIDKHVGKTDTQLLQRLEDQANGAGRPTIPAASSFPDLESAQRYTQYCIRSNTTEIQDWLKNPPPAKPSEVFVVSSVPSQGPVAGQAVTGRVSDVVNNQATPVKDAHGVATRLKYDPNLNPPFVVVTSMPK